MADASTLGSRITAARAMTTTQTGGSPSASSDSAAVASPKAESGSSAATSTESPASSTAAETGASATPESTESSTTPAETPGESSGDDKSKTEADLKKQFVSIDKREKALKRKRREWEKSKEEKEAEFARARQELISESNRISALQRQAEQKFGWAARGESAWKNDDKVTFAKAIEKMAGGASLASITQWLAGATDKPSAPAQSQPSEEEQAWRREKAEWERKQAEERAKAEGSKKETASAEKREQARARLASAFGKHPFLANPDDPSKPDPDALQEAFEAFEGAMKSRRVGESAREVAKRTLDALHARELRRLKRLGLEPKAPPAAEKGPEKKTGERLPEPPPSKSNGKPPSADETRASRIAAARRMSEMQRRGVLS